MSKIQRKELIKYLDEKYEYAKKTIIRDVDFKTRIAFASFFSIVIKMVKKGDVDDFKNFLKILDIGEKILTTHILPDDIKKEVDKKIKELPKEIQSQITDDYISKLIEKFDNPMIRQLITDLRQKIGDIIFDESLENTNK
ncbi:MAG: hypothetical protein OH363_06020 [Candidatus Parvarchaeota archaeon]|nr:hypothetical protein [Candidatus Jingweiarchaeum tengchongense]